MTGERLSWSHWLQHYPPAPQQVYASMPCRVCQEVRRLPLFSLMSAPSHTATFVCSGVACECNVPNTDVRPWVALERTAPLVYSLTNDAIVPQNSSITQFPAASSPPSQQRTRRLSRETESTSDSHAPHRGRKATRRVEIAHISQRTPHEVKKERTSHSNSRSGLLRCHSDSSPSISPSHSPHFSDSDHSARRHSSRSSQSPRHYGAFDPFGRSRPKPRHFIVGRELRYFSEPPPTRSEEQEFATSSGQSSIRRMRREFDKWTSGCSEVLFDGRGEAYRFLNWEEYLKAYFRREGISNSILQARLAKRTFRGKVTRW